MINVKVLAINVKIMEMFALLVRLKIVLNALNELKIVQNVKLISLFLMIIIIFLVIHIIKSALMLIHILQCFNNLNINLYYNTSKISHISQIEQI